MRSEIENQRVCVQRARKIGKTAVRALVAGTCSLLSSGIYASDPLLADVAEIRPGVLAGYLGVDGLPDSVLLLPPPPSPGSPAERHDEEMAQNARASSPARWQLAIDDADVGFPQATSHFICPLGTKVTASGAPSLYRLLQRVRTDAAASVDAAKDHYQRARPFTRNGGPTCNPEKQEGLAGNGSYPSGHAAMGWAWALVLAELAPDRSDALFARGLEIGESRIVCNVHWRSDVDQGRLMASATIARLHGDLVFRTDMEAARTELAQLREESPIDAAACAKDGPGAYE